MNPAILLLAGFCTYLGLPTDTFTTTKEWTLSTPVYAQIKIVPSMIDEANEISVQQWSGPWGTYRHFCVYFGYAEGGKASSGHFQFVTPRIGIEGWSDKSGEGDDRTVKLFNFNAASNEKDIAVKMDELPPHPEIDKAYKVATVSGRNGIATWEVRVRFVTRKPEYIRKN